MSNCNNIYDHNNCLTCGCCIEECTCDTPPYDNSGCLDTESSDCIIYPNSLPCVPIQTGNTLTIVIQRIATLIKNLWNHVTSNSLVITPSGGACNSDVTIEIVPSTDPDNIFILGTDGYPYVPAPTTGITDVNIINGSCITWTKTLVGTVLTFTPVIDWNCVASQTCAIGCEDLCPNPLNLTVN